MTLTASNSLQINTTFTSDADLGTDTATLRTSYGMNLTDGTGVNQADMMFKDLRQVSASTNDDIDLTSIEDAFGNALSAAEVVTVIIRSLDTNTTDLTIGGSGADYPGMPDQTIAPGGIAFVHNAGASGLGAVADGSADTIRVANGAGATASYEIVVIARSA